MTTEHVQLDHRAGVRIVPLVQLRTMHRMLKLVVIMQIINLALQIWRLRG